jgi:hypothetical protein
MSNQATSRTFLGGLGLVLGGLALLTVGGGLIVVSVMSMSSPDAVLVPLIGGGVLLVVGVVLLVNGIGRWARRNY